ncbi:deoxynucleoside kinase [Loa loa]|uniref:NADH dehydrogenase [ubiquinone] 1 alpha subcomplex subunit 10, mitochondrial n=1 Tax=Loa loa TaxID=7209 RepID=A0A1I7VM73_LOALO|nr:deoxynucleoside kinase [Loa loa]EFO23371.1 deoxynucleoside kinase [Loa loa]
MAGALCKWVHTGHRLRTSSSSVFGGIVQFVSQKRTIVKKSKLKLDPDTYPKPWPYKEKGYRWQHVLVDRTLKRFHENSKLIVVEGNIGSNKSDMARSLADRLGFYFIPEFQMDEVLIDRFGNDYRNYYHLFPKSFRLFDMNMFYKDPFNDETAKMRDRILRCKFDQYLNAVAHVMNTGQGVVLERTPHTDFIFANACRVKNYIGPEYFTYYYIERKNMIPNCRFWPHLVIYLDVPVDKCLENIRQKGSTDKIAVVDRTYLQTIEDSYKDALKEFRKHSEILVYDWTTPGNVDNVVEDIEDMDFDFFEHHKSDVFGTWENGKNELDYSIARNFVTDKREAHALAFLGLPEHECGELYQSPRELGRYIQCIHNEILKTPYVYSAIKNKGDKFGWFSKISTFTKGEPWFQYYYKDAYLEDLVGVQEVISDPTHQSYYNQIHNEH